MRGGPSLSPFPFDFAPPHQGDGKGLISFLQEYVPALLTTFGKSHAFQSLQCEDPET